MGGLRVAITTGGAHMQESGLRHAATGSVGHYCRWISVLTAALVHLFVNASG